MAGNNVATSAWRRRLLPPAVVALVLALWAGPLVFRGPLPLEGDAPRDGMTRVGGALHVHTTLSDGTGEPDEVVRAARDAGLQYVLITDHNTDAAAASVAGYRDGVLVLVGTEISTHAGHLLAFGMPRLTFPLAAAAGNALDDVRHLGGAAFVAHPYNVRDELAWRAWEVPGPWGLEVLNMDSLWRQASWPAVLRALLAYPFNPVQALASGIGRPTAELGGWDALLRNRNVPALAGVDAHGSLLGQGGGLPEVPSYADLFRVLRTWAVLDAPLSGESARDARAVSDALARGRSYLALDALAPAGGFQFHAAAGGVTWQMGETLAPAPDLVLRAGGRLPRGARVELYRDGERVAEGLGAVEYAAPAPGTYRVEVRLADRDIPWLLSNPIYVYGAAEAAERERQAAWPTEPSLAARASSGRPLAGASALVAESGGGAWVDPAVRQASTRDPGASAARLRFRFAESAAGDGDVWAALVDRSRRDLSGDSGLLAEIRADGVYRIWVGLWEQRPAAADPEPDWWVSSLRTTTGWRRHAVPFDRLRPAATNVDETLDLRRVMGLVLYVDPGTPDFVREGNVWFERLGAF